jgi:hypothetical protein
VEEPVEPAGDGQLEPPQDVGRRGHRSLTQVG